VSAASKYRLYIDEVGNHDLNVADRDPSDLARYLSLTGVIVELEYVRSTLSPSLEGLKASFFNPHPDDPIVLHRREILGAKPPFEALSDPSIRQRFDTQLLALISELDYSVITVTVDKGELVRRYRDHADHPYHYCLQALIERFAFELRDQGAVGDVLAESRGASEDRSLKEAFRRLAEGGTRATSARLFDRHLTSVELKVKPKSANIAGLQVADLLARPALEIMLSHEGRRPPPDRFGGQVARLLDDAKFRRGPGGAIEGYGTKWLP